MSKLDMFQQEHKEPKAKKIRRHMKICFTHHQKQYGNVPCDKCIADDEFFKKRPDYIEDIINANIFAKHTGVWFAAFGPGVRFGAEHDWYETFDIPSGVLKLIVKKLEAKK